MEYLKTGKAQPPRGFTNKNDIGYFPPKAPLEQRYSNAIEIGFPKCGTSTMIFFNCHSSFVYREAAFDEILIGPDLGEKVRLSSLI